MTRLRIHLGVSVDSMWFAGRLLTRLRNSSSVTLRQRLVGWGTGPMRERSVSLGERINLVNQSVRRLRSTLAVVGDEFERGKAQMVVCGARHATFQFTDERLDLVLSLDIQAFLSQLWTAVQLLDRFLIDFFRLILDKRIGNKEERRHLFAAHGIQDHSLSVLTDVRHLVTHSLTSLLAADVDPDQPQAFDIVILRGTPRPDDWFPQPVPLSRLFSALEEFRTNLRHTENWLMEEIDAFERNDTSPQVAPT